MKRMNAKSGLTLVEMLVVVGIIAAVVAFGLPAVKAFFRSFESEDSVRMMIEAALSSARSMAIEQQEYVGVRFQKAYVKGGDPLSTPQYMVFIIHDKTDTGLADGFRAVEGIRPIRLPDLFGLTDLTLVDRVQAGSRINVTKEYPLSYDAGLDSPAEVNEITTFSVVFSRYGHLVIHDVRVRNHDGEPGNPTPARDSTKSRDDVFNTMARITDSMDPRGMFIQDDYVQERLGPESSRGHLFIYSRAELMKAYKAGQAWSGYLSRLKGRPLTVAPLTGTLTGAR